MTIFLFQWLLGSCGICKYSHKYFSLVYEYCFILYCHASLIPIKFRLKHETQFSWHLRKQNLYLMHCVLFCDKLLLDIYISTIPQHSAFCFQEYFLYLMLVIVITLVFSTISVLQIPFIRNTGTHISVCYTFIILNLYFKLTFNFG